MQPRTVELKGTVRCMEHTERVTEQRKRELSLGSQRWECAGSRGHSYTEQNKESGKDHGFEEYAVG